jgi:hypothetical protein
MSQWHSPEKKYAAVDGDDGEVYSDAGATVVAEGG